MTAVQRLDSIAFWTLVALTGFIPFFFIPLPWITIIQSKVLLLSIAFTIAVIAFFIARSLEREVRIPAQAALYVAAFLPVAYALSALVNGFHSVSLVGSGVEADTLAVIGLSFGTLLLFAAVHRRDERLASYTLLSFTLGIFVLECIELVHIALPTFSFGGVIALMSGNAFGSLHEYSMILGLGLMIGILYVRRGPFPQWFNACLYAFLALTTSLIALASFTDVWIALSTISALVLLEELWRRKSLPDRHFWKREMLLIALIVVSILMIFGSNILTSYLPGRIRISQAEVRPSWIGTLSIAPDSLAGLVSSVFGTGPNTFARVWGLRKPVDVNQTPFWDTSFESGVATIPTSLITVGILGFLAWLAFLSVSLWSLRNALISSWDGRGRAIVLPLSSIIAYLIFFHVFYAPGSVMMSILFLMLGLLIAYCTDQAHRVGLPGSPYDFRAWGMVGVVTLAACALVIASLGIVRVTTAHTLINRAALIYNTTSDFDRAAQSVATSLRIYGNNDRAHRAAVQIGLLQLQRLVANADPNKADARAQLQATLQNTITHGLQAVSIGSSDYQNWLELAALYTQLAGANIEGAYDRAREAYSRAHEENPTSPIPLYHLAQLEVLNGNSDQAIEYLVAALRLKSDFAPAHYLASQIYVSKGDLKIALQAAASAAQAASGESEAWYNLGAVAFTAGEYSVARDALERALSFQPRFANAMYVLGLAYDTLGARQDAIRVFEALDSLDPGHAEVQKILSNLRSGKPALDVPRTKKKGGI
ncbi:tetratricopeptide repeat protein [Candidatus Kaiserbacteria bacterium]|nr:tetratricopeptide repeat protein [Candidatus Kaiserbacteria bacterium]